MDTGLTGTPNLASAALGSLPGLRRFGRLIGNTDSEPLVLIGCEPEQLVLDDWAAGREAVVIVPDFLLDRRGKRIDCAKDFVAVVVIGGAVDLLVPDLSDRFTLPPGLRPDSGAACVCAENCSTASMGRIMPAIPETPPWLTAGILCQRSLLSMPSICQLIWLARVPFSEPYPPAPELEKPGARMINCVKSLPFSGVSCSDFPLTPAVCVVDVVSSASALAMTSTVSPAAATVNLTGKV